MDKIWAKKTKVIIYNIMIEQYHNLLLEEEIQLLDDKCQNFIETHSPFVNGKVNRSYHKYKLDEKTELLGLQVRMTEFLKKVIGHNNIEFTGFVINRADTTTNQNDEYHVDISDYTIVTYLNEDFVGGDFIYSLDNVEHINNKVQKGLSIVMNNKVPHKISPVTTGVRFSFACFFNKIVKKNKSLI
jgi:hypothetical protein